VIFFTKGYKTETMWLYDGRSNVPHVTKKDRPLTSEHFAEFERCFGVDPSGKAKRKPSDSKEDRWRSFHIDEVKKRDFKIDSLKWLKDESPDDGDDVLEPEELATDAIAELQFAIDGLNGVLSLLENGTANDLAGIEPEIAK
jgi:type I restriction enzyme M protein